jgi:hypothetical protein
MVLVNGENVKGLGSALYSGETGYENFVRAGPVPYPRFYFLFQMASECFHSNFVQQGTFVVRDLLVSYTEMKRVARNTARPLNCMSSVDK